MWPEDVNDVMHRKRTLRILRDLKKRSVSWDWDLGEARQICALRAPHVLGRADGKVRIERWYLSPYVGKPLNSKVIKSFVPELRSRKSFSCFGIPMLSMYMSYEYHMYILHIRIMGMLHAWPRETTSDESFFYLQCCCFGCSNRCI